MKSLAEGAARAGRQRVADLISQGAEVTYRNPEAVAAAKADPNQVIVENDDGSVTIKGIKVDEASPWVGTEPVSEEPVTEGTELEETVLANTALNEGVTLPVDQDGAVETVPETREQIDAQMRDMLDPKNARVAVFVPFGGYMPAKPDVGYVGKTEVKANRETGDEAGVIFYNSRKKLGRLPVGKGTVRLLEAEGRRNELLGLGPYNKSDLAARGGAPMAVVETNAEGTRVRETAATDSTVDEQAAAMEATKGEGSTVTVTTAEDVLNARQEGQTEATPEVTAPKAQRAKRVSKARAEPKPKAEPFKTIVHDVSLNPAGFMMADVTVETKVDGKKELRRVKRLATKDDIAQWEEQGGKTVEEKAAEKPKAKETRPAKGMYWDEKQSKTMVEERNDEGEYVTREATAEEVRAAQDKRNDEIAARATELNKEDGEGQSVATVDDSELTARRVTANRGKFRSAKEEMQARIPDDSKEGEKTKNERIRQAEQGDSIREKFGPKPGQENMGRLNEIETRFKQTLAAADRAGIKIGEVSDITPNSVAWLAQMKLVAGKLAKLPKAESKKARLSILSQLADFLSSELDYMQTGSTESFRATRKEVGESIKTARNAATGTDGDVDMISQIPDENTPDIEETLDREPEEEQANTRKPEPEVGPEFKAGDNVIVVFGDGKEQGTIVSGPEMRGDRPFYRVRFADGAEDRFPADGFNMLKVRKPAEITSQGNDELGPIDEEGDGGVRMQRRAPLYSPALRAAEALTQNKGTGQQFLSMIQKTPGVKQEELDWMGLTQWLADQKTVTKQEIVDYINANQVVVSDTVKADVDYDTISPSETVIARYKDEWEANAAEIRKARVERDEASQNVFKAKNKEAAEKAQYLLDEADYILNGLMADQDALHEKMVEETVAEMTGGDMPEPTSFSGWQTPGGTDYRELLMTIPSDVPRSEIDVRVDDYIDRNMSAYQEDDNTWTVYDGDYNFSLSTAYTTEQVEAVMRDYAEHELRRTGQLADDENTFYYRHHWNEGNVVAHIRFTTRVINGLKTMFVQEIQSDWGQQGRKRGFRQKRDALKQLESASAAAKAKRTETKLALLKAREKLASFRLEGNTTEAAKVEDEINENLGPRAREADRAYAEAAKALEAAYKPNQAEVNRIRAEADAALAAVERSRRKSADLLYAIAGEKNPAKKQQLEDELNEHEKMEFALIGLSRDWNDELNEALEDQADATPVPDMPFKSNWKEMAFRRAAAYAAENGFEQVAWASGQMNADLFSLERRIGRVQYSPVRRFDRVVGFDTMVFDPDGSALYSGYIRDKKLDDIVGKELAAKMRAGEGSRPYNTTDRVLEGFDLKTGGEGMKGFYDKILPEYAKKWGKKFAAGVGKAEMVTPEGNYDVWTMPVTDQMRMSVNENGVPMFQARDRAGGPIGQMPTDGSEARVASRTVTLNDLRDEVFGPQALMDMFDVLRKFTDKQKGLQRLIGRRMFKALLDVTGDVKVHVLPDAMFNLYAPNAEGYYNKNGDYIVVRESVMEDPTAAMHTILHEAVHAAFEHTIKQSAKFRQQIERLLSLSKEHAAKTGYDVNAQAFDDIHEFMSEALSNPRFQEFLATVPIMQGAQRLMNIEPSQVGIIRNVLDWIKAKVGDMLGIQQAMAAYRPGTQSALEISLEVGGKILELAPRGRQKYYAARPDEAAGAQSVMPMRRDVDPNSNEGKLRARGVSDQQAENIAAMIDEEFGGTVTDEELDVIAAALGKPIGSQQGLTGPSPFMPPKLPGRVAKLFNWDPSRGIGLNRAILYASTLDFIDTKFRKFFGDKAGNALSDYVNAQFAYQKIAQDIADAHDRDMADYYDLKRAAPEEARKIDLLVEMLRSTQIDISENATNDHLKKGNARRYLQSKKMLPEVQALMASMDPETLELVRRMAKNFTESFNDHMRAVTYTILEGLDTKLSNSDMMRIIDHVVTGKLDAQDKADINDDEVYEQLERSEFLRRRKGSYFPAERFGNWVVLTTTKIRDPKITSVVTKSGRQTVPIKTEIDDKTGTVRFSFDYGIRGSRVAVSKKIYEWVGNHDLPLLSYVVKYRDRQTGEIVSKGEMDVTRDYDMVHEVKLQNRGVHMFETPAEARAFEAEADKDRAAGLLTENSTVLEKHAQRHHDHMIPAGALNAVFRAIDRNQTIKDDRRKQQMKNAVRDAMVAQMPGNRYEKHLLGRQNVLGASNDTGRAAAYYGRAVGNSIARIRSGGERAEALARMREVEAASRKDKAKGTIVSMVVNEVVRREDMTDGPMANNQMLDNLSTLNSVDKLFSPANWFLNMTQVPLNSLPFLGGRFGNVKAARKIIETYNKIGAAGALKSGLKNTGKTITSVGKSRIDMDDVIGSIRKNAGVQYNDLFDTLISTGDITDNVGIENAAQLAAGRGNFGTALVKMDRILRAMPNAIEAVNRSTVAIAAYDLARASGMSKADAIDYTREALRRTQFRYDEANKSRLMRSNPALRFFFTFKQFGQGQYQMLADALGRAFKDASPTERAMARKQLYTLVAMQALTAGVFSVPAIELFKVAFMMGAALGLGDGWDDDMDELRESMRGAWGRDWEEVVSKGLLSKVMGVDLSSRISWADLIIGYPPRSGEKEDIYSWLGKSLAGPQGAMVFEMFIEGPKALIEGDYAKGLTLMLPVKAISDTVKAAGAMTDEKMGPLEAAKQVAGFKSLSQARISDAQGARIRAGARQKREVGDLIGDYLNAVSRGDVARAAAAIRDYNANLPEGERKINIGDRNSGLEKRRRENARLYAE